MDKALEYLNDYLVDPTILTSLAANDPLIDALPMWWRDVMRADGANRNRVVIETWEPFREQMPLTLSFLSSHLRRVCLLTDIDNVANRTSVRLLYELERDGEVFYYAGGNPVAKLMSASAQTAWNRLPSHFRRFYDSLHNGWYYLASCSLGPSPTEDFSVLDESEWEILEEIGDPGCDLHDLLAVYTNGMGAYVALSISGNSAYGDVIFWHDRAPTLRIDAWAVIDAWTEIGLRE